MTADSLQPPDFILILECNSIHLICTVCLKKTAQTLYTLSRTCYVWKHYINDIFLTDTTRFFFFSILCRLVNYKWICTKHTRIWSYCLCCCHCNIFCIHTTSCPNSFSINCIWHGCTAKRIVRQFNFYMRNHRAINFLSFLWMNYYKFFRHIVSGSWIIVSCDHCWTVIWSIFSN